LRSDESVVPGDNLKGGPSVIILYEHPLSPYAQKCKIALGEKGIAFEAKVPQAFGTGATSDQGFIAENPRHEVPALVDGDVQIFDSTIILEYLEDKWPEPPLLPKAPAERARLRMLEDVMDTQYEAINWGIMEILAFRRASGALREQLLGRAAEQTAKLQAWLERELEGRGSAASVSAGATLPWCRISTSPSTTAIGPKREAASPTGSRAPMRGPASPLARTPPAQSSISSWISAACSRAACSAASTGITASNG
jgi:glutathione S-transferase